mmetsp:Transcript_13040/g.27750  ORF Transcript_13040/g.27750 Transcript_13040/m.27750 type:complete len:443 (-) Transcript_13040:308-1636(-)
MVAAATSATSGQNHNMSKMKAHPIQNLLMLVAYHFVVSLLLSATTLAAHAPRSFSTHFPTSSLRGQDDILLSEIGALEGLIYKKGSMRKDNLLEGINLASRPLAGTAFVHRSQGRKIDCGIGSKQQKIVVSPLGTILSIRGGASDSKMQNIVRSILSSQSLPSPIKQFIQLVCKLVENITGMRILPSKKETRKSNGKRRVNEVFVEETIGTKARRPKSQKNLPEEVAEEIECAIDSEPRKKKKITSSAKSNTKSTPNVATDESSSTKKDEPSKLAKKTNARPDAASKKFLSNNLKSSNPNYRIQRELKEFLTSPPPGLSVKISGKNVRLWIITLSMPNNCIYAGETYKLRVQFPNDYPTSPPSVYFLPPTPRHEHVYTNGDICLSLLGKDWRPIMTAQSLAQAIMSILCGAQGKSLPMDNSRHAGNKPGQKQDDWVYHDDNC